ncbi:hypothetical protein A8M77_14370 [Variovorax sp. JS1663]|nr:hypothetical protein A8M77_14370 [Variovorax sp. JS1663]
MNGPQGSDLPSELDDALRQAFALLAQLRDGAGTPIGAVCQMPIATAPTGFLKLNGALISRTTYAALFAFATSAGLVSEAAWTAGSSGCFSVGDGSTTFRLPDLRGVFTRGLDESRGIDVSRVLGVFQDHANVTHNHGINDSGHGHAVSDPTHQHAGSTDAQGFHDHPYTGAVNTVFTAGGASPVAQATSLTTSGAGNHAHNVVTDFRATGIAIVANGTGISIQSQGASDGHPRNVAYPYYMKF